MEILALARTVTTFLYRFRFPANKITDPANKTVIRRIPTNR